MRKRNSLKKSLRCQKTLSRFNCWLLLGFQPMAKHLPTVHKDCRQMTCFDCQEGAWGSCKSFLKLCYCVNLFVPYFYTIPCSIALQFNIGLLYPYRLLLSFTKDSSTVKQTKISRLEPNVWRKYLNNTTIGPPQFTVRNSYTVPEVIEEF